MPVCSGWLSHLSALCDVWRLLHGLCHLSDWVISLMVSGWSLEGREVGGFWGLWHQDRNTLGFKSHIRIQHIYSLLIKHVQEHTTSSWHVGYTERVDLPKCVMLPKVSLQILEWIIGFTELWHCGKIVKSSIASLEFKIFIAYSTVACCIQILLVWSPLVWLYYVTDG